MSGNESVESQLNHDVLAFEYVTGVMRGEERQVFERLLHNNESLADQVRFWEEQLMQLSDEDEQRPLAPEVWSHIQAQLNLSSSQTESMPATRFMWPRWFAWAIPSLACLIFASLLLVTTLQKNNAGPNADYVAVLTDTQGAARLTVLTATKGTALWLKWNQLNVAPNKNVQLWAVSKTDKQIRPLGVFSQSGVSQVDLSVPNWRLIKDAEFLLLTEEEVGGSPIDEPSDIVLAKGVCVLLAKIDT